MKPAGSWRGREGADPPGQDSTAYRDGEAGLPMLLTALTRIQGVEWVRLMYAYPGRISTELMSVMAAEEKICKYLDIPIQHFDDKVLAAMNRRGTSKTYAQPSSSSARGCRDRASYFAHRGFPGETEAAFKRLLAFVKRRSSSTSACSPILRKRHNSH